MITITHGLVSGQVLQRLGKRGASVQIRGRSEQAGPVKVRVLSGKKAKVQIVGQAERGAFSAELKGVPVGGPYQLVFEIGPESLTVTDIFVGDVWILAGQSNMEGCGSLQNLTPTDPQVRALYMNGCWDLAADPLHCVEDSPDTAHAPIPLSKRVRARLDKLRTKGVGPGISFGTEMVKRSEGVPQGLLGCAHGGTSMQQWDPRSKSLGGASMYGSMLRVVRETGQPVAGVLWYQGEAETVGDGSADYFESMVRLIRGFRRDLKQPELAFILVQLGREYRDVDAESWNRIQLEQARLPQKLAGVACVPAVDLPMEDCIHLSSEGQFRLGHRLASAADRLVYGNAKEMPTPEIESVVRVRQPAEYFRGNLGLIVTFKNVKGSLHSDGPVEGFGLMDANGNVFHPFHRATIQGNRVRLEALNDLRGRENFRLVYGYGRKPVCSLADSCDMAVGVSGPFAIKDPLALSGPFGHWRVSELRPEIASVENLSAAPRRDEFELRDCRRAVFVTPSETPLPSTNGIIFFFTEVEVSETMRGNFRFGYDGPFRAWLNDRELFVDSKGTNPIIADETVCPVRLTRGRHRLAVAMDFRSGRSWGFLLRFNRVDLTERQLETDVYAFPTCCL